jgi:hypothetical protein
VFCTENYFLASLKFVRSFGSLPEWSPMRGSIVFATLTMKKRFDNIDCTGLYYKNITIVNDASRVVIMMIVSDITTWSIPYNCN